MSVKQELVKYFTTDGQPIEFPIFTFEGKNKGGMSAIVTAGIHGAEYPPIAAAVKFANMIDPDQVIGKLTIVTCSVIPSFKNRTMFVCPIDHINPNRVFPGKKDGSYTEQLAYYLYRDYISKADIHLDLHCGDMIESLISFAECPQGDDPEKNEISYEIAKYYGVPNIVRYYLPKDKKNLNCYQGSFLAGIPANLLEYGGHGQCYKEDVDNHIKGLFNVMRHFGILEGEAFEPKPADMFDAFAVFSAPCEGLCFLDIKPGDYVKKGQIIGHMEDLFGKYLADVVSPANGKVLYFTDTLAMYGDLYLGDLGIRKAEQ